MNAMLEEVSEKSLTTSEQNRLTKLETVIEDGMKVFVGVGSALADIRDERLYRDKFDTFEEYCRKRWYFGSSRARQLISASAIARAVTNVTIDNEAQARALIPVPEKKRVRVMAKVAKLAEKEGKPITASMIKEVAGLSRPRGGLYAQSLELKEEKADGKAAKEPVRGTISKARAVEVVEELYESNKAKWNLVPPPTPRQVIDSVVKALKNA